MAAVSEGGGAAPAVDLQHAPDWMFREMTLFVRGECDNSRRAVVALRSGALRDVVSVLDVDEIRKHDSAARLPPWLRGVPTLFVRDREEIFMGRDAIEFLAESNESVLSTAGISGTFRSRNERIGARPIRPGRRTGHMVRASVLDVRTMDDPDVRAQSGKHEGPMVDMDTGPMQSAGAGAALSRSGDPHVSGMARRREALNDLMRRNREQQMAMASAAFAASAAAAGAAAGGGAFMGPVPFEQEEA